MRVTRSGSKYSIESGRLQAVVGQSATPEQFEQAKELLLPEGEFKISYQRWLDTGPITEIVGHLQVRLLATTTKLMRHGLRDHKIKCRRQRFERDQAAAREYTKMMEESRDE